MIVRSHEFNQYLAFIDRADVLAIDTETTGLNPWRDDRIVGISVAGYQHGEMVSYYFPFRHGDGYNLPEEFIKPLIAALEHVPKLLMFNSKFDLQMLYREGMQMPLDPERCEDVMIAAHLMNENEESFALKRLADKYLGAGSSMDEAELTRLLKQRYGQKATKGDLWRLKSEEVDAYACSDTELTYRLWELYRQPLETWKLTKLYMEMNRYSLIINQMEIRGFMLDVPLIHQMIDTIGPRMEELRSEINDMAGYELNPRSPKQVCEAFGIESSAADVLEALDSPLAKKIVEFRHWAKAARTYYNPYLERMDANHVIHPSFWVTGTVAGRLSCRDPNLQNVPRQGTYFQVRDVFIARPGHRLLEVDYEQAELRIAAHYAKDKRMIDIFNKERDPHQETAYELFRDEAIQTATMLALFSGVYPDSPGAEVLSRLFTNDQERSLSETCVQFRRQIGKDQETGSGERGKSTDRAEISHMEKWDWMVQIASQGELRTVRERILSASASQGSGSIQQHSFQFRDALQVLSSAGARVVQEFPEWKERRNTGKTLGFGVLYGMGISGFCRNTGKSYEEAKAYLDAYHGLYPGFRSLSNHMADMAQRQGYIRLETGRVRRYDGVHVEYRKAMNNLIQGTAAEVIRLSMMRLFEEVPEAPMLIQVHDSLIFEIPDDVPLEPTFKKIKNIMEGFKFNPAMKIDAKIGTRWGSLEPYDVA